MRAEGLRFEDFSPAVLEELFGDSYACHYVRGYLARLHATSILVEPHYIDRHYLDDFANYYARSFKPPEPWCSRVHFFERLGKQQLVDTFGSAYPSEATRDIAERALRAAYLGFIVRRPLAGATIGRTVLKTYPVEGRRHYPVVRPYEVHVAGLSLRIDGLAYQQQDRGAAVCASTALWSALQRVARVAGHRTPTPTAITRAAGSPFPASAGLDQMQMAAALSSLGYLADRFAPEENRPLFRAMLVACLDSQLPVILLITRKEPTGAGEVPIGHAVCVTGYSEPPTVASVPATRADRPPIAMKGGAVVTLYVHDDNLGSHAHYELFDNPDDTDLLEGYPKLMLRRGRSTAPPRPTAPAPPASLAPGPSVAPAPRDAAAPSDGEDVAAPSTPGPEQVVPSGPATATPADGTAGDWWPVDEWAVFGALVPKPDKLRLSIRQLLYDLIELRPIFRAVLPRLAIHFAPHFGLGVDYKRSLFQLGLDAAALRAFMETPLPRHVGILSVFCGDVHILDAILDVSEVERDPGSPPVLSIVAPGVEMNSIAWVLLVGVANHFKWPLVTRPAASVPSPPTATPPPP